MMNELLELSRQLQQAGVVVPMQHIDVRRAAEGKRKLIVRLAQDGRPVSYHLSEDNIFFCHGRRNHHAFPVITTKQPLCDPKSIPENTSNPNMLSESFVLNEKNQDIKISDWTRSQLEKICHEHEELKSLGALIERFPDKNSTKRFNRSLVDLIQADIAYRPDLHTVVRSIFFESDTQIIFDIAEAYPQSLPILYPDLWRKLICLLRERDQIEEDNSPVEKQGISYLSGQTMVLERDKTPDPTLPVLGNTFVYTRDNSVKYLERFGLNGLDFHMGKVEINAAVDALVYLLQEEFRDRTWRALPGQRKTQNLLLAYVEQKPQSGFAELLGGSDELYAEVVARVMEQFQDQYTRKGEMIPPGVPKYTIRLLVLGKIDDARKQTLLNRQYKVKKVIESALEWQQHFEGCPGADLGGRVHNVEPMYPMDIADLTQKVWGTRNGKFRETDQIPPINLGDLYDLYIPPNGMLGYKDLCRGLLERFVTQGWDLIAYIGHASCRGEIKNGQKAWDKLIKYALRFLGVFAMLLDKLNTSREGNMTSVAFLLGQLLKALDIIHKEYCRANSPKNPLPPRLLGNAHYPVAFDRPLEALELLSQRMPIYIAWVDTAESSTEIAKEALRQLAYVMGRELFEESAFENWGSEQRAQLMQGYLTKLPQVD